MITHHRWFATGSGGRYVGHSSRPGPGQSTDTHGVGQGEDYIGPLGSQKAALAVAAALANAYQAGRRDLLDEQSGRASWPG